MAKSLVLIGSAQLAAIRCLIANLFAVSTVAQLADPSTEARKPRKLLRETKVVAKAKVLAKVKLSCAGTGSLLVLVDSVVLANSCMTRRCRRTLLPELFGAS